MNSTDPSSGHCLKMNSTEEHHRAVDDLVGELRRFLATRSEWVVLSRVRWQPLVEFPQCEYGFDAMVVPRDAVLEWNETRCCLGPSLRPWVVFDLVSKHRHDFDEYHDKGNDLCLAGVSEYCLWDPTAEWMRPPLRAWRLREGALRPVASSARGVFFSVAGFRMEVRGPVVEFSPAGIPHVEEELFTCLRQLDEAALGRLKREQGAIDGLTARVNRLRAKLGRAGT